MKLTIKQNIYVVDKGHLNVGETVEIENEVQAQSLIEAGYAETAIKVEEKQPSEETAEATAEEVKPKRRRNGDK
ncbi:MAG TPA: hypothetical protein VK190_04390 [Pseudoneobacillus sp.]|nr:hypothetical protein [Pseudoneobacillus sp.]